MPYITQLGADETTGSTVLVERLDRIESEQREILAGQKRAETRWKWQTIAGVAGAVFAAVRLGIIAVPTIREYRRRPAEPVENPSRRRRRRRRR